MYFSFSKQAGLSAGFMEKFIFFYIFDLIDKLPFGIKMCKIKFSIELNTFQIDDKDLATTNICEKNVQIFIMDDSLLSHQPIYSRFLDYSLVHHVIYSYIIKYYFTFT